MHVIRVCISMVVKCEIDCETLLSNTLMGLIVSGTTQYILLTKPGFDFLMCAKLIKTG